MAPPITPGTPVVLQVNHLNSGLRRGQFGRALKLVEGGRVLVECLGSDGQAHAEVEMPAASLLAVVCEPLAPNTLKTLRVPMLAAAGVGVVGAIAAVLGVAKGKHLADGVTA